MAAKKQVNITQVAKAAGVSTQTVSRVINNRPDVAPATRLRVQRVIEQVNYRPNILARSLIHRRSNTIGVVAMASSYYGPSNTLVGIEKMIRNLGYSLLLDFMHHPERDDVELIINRLLSHQVDGILWAIPEIGNNRAWLQRQNAHLPIPVIYLSMEPRAGLPVVAIDNRSGASLATEHLLHKGFHNIGLIAGPPDWWEARQRQAGWKGALHRAGLPADERQIVAGDWSAASGEACIRSLWEQFSDMDAVFVGNDQMALGVLQAAHRSGRRVPQDLAVVGFDNIPESRYFWPGLTTIDQPLIELGGRAVQALSGRIEAEYNDEHPAQTGSLLLKPTLVVRDSS
ncbi:MAG TPA: LacI family DNA-binding transcriptional regulator [Anaerolineales bacterium]|nr:LacI family DNA-binding transcriptional regulator [Anaerolineales bacterium]